MFRSVLFAMLGAGTAAFALAIDVKQLRRVYERFMSEKRRWELESTAKGPFMDADGRPFKDVIRDQEGTHAVSMRSDQLDEEGLVPPPSP